MNLKDYKGKKPRELEPLDELFLIQLNKLILNATNDFKNYEYSLVKQKVENFFWKDFCDNYLEIVKKRIYNEKGNKKISAQYTLYHSLLTLIKLFAPFIPFITEEVYQEHYKKTEKIKSIHISDWPIYKKEKKESLVKKYEKGKLGVNKWEVLLEVISKVRQEKSNAKKPMNAPIILGLERYHYYDLKPFLEDLKSVSCAKEINDGSFSVKFIEENT
jgi:valyl-tRNA synthetase